jgi:hypothetical protein
MRKLLLVTVALSLVLVAALPSVVSAQPCNPYNQGVWQTQAPVPTPMVRAWGQFFPGNGNFYALGGRQTDVAGSDYLNPREYNPSSNTWTVKASAFPDNNVNNMVGGILNIGGTNVIVLVGGSPAGGTTATAAVRTYDPMTDTITPLPLDNWPGNANGTTLPGGSAVVGNTLYVFGGFNINVAMTSEIWAFDGSAPAGSRWTLKAATHPNPRAQVDVYNPVTNSFTTAPSMLTARRNFPVDLSVSGEEMWAVGGYDLATGLPIQANEHFRCQVPVDLMSFDVN